MSSKANAKSIFKQVVDGCSCNLAICVLFIKVCRAYEMKRLIFIIASHLAWSILIHFTDLKKVYFLPLAATVGESRVVPFFFWSHMVRTALKTSETTFLPLHFRWPCSCFRIELEASCARCTASCTGSCVADLTLVLFWFLKAVPLSGQEIFRCLACRSLFQHQILAYLGLPFRLCNLFMNFIVIS